MSYENEKNTKSTFYILSSLCFIGVILVGWGISMSTQPNADRWVWLFLTSFGGSIFGACLSNLISTINTKRLFNLIKNQAESKFSSEEETIKNFRQLYHNYWITLSNGEFVWTYTTLDYETNHIPGELVGRIPVKNPNKKNSIPVFYKSKAIIRGQRGIIIDESPEVGQEPVISIFPKFTKTFNQTQYGLTILENNDYVDRIVPMIVSIAPINDWKTVGLVDNKTSEFLWDLWKKNFSDNVIVDIKN